VIVRRIGGRRVWALVRDLGEQSGITGLHPHALRHACAVELLKRTKNLRAVQQHLRHRDIQSTTVYARLLPDELAEAVKALDGRTFRPLSTRRVLVRSMRHVFDLLRAFGVVPEPCSGTATMSAPTFGRLPTRRVLVPFCAFAFVDAEKHLELPGTYRGGRRKF